MRGDILTKLSIAGLWLKSRGTQGTVSNTHHDIVKAGVIISEVHCDVMDSHNMGRNMLKIQEGGGDQDWSASVIYTLSVTEQALTTKGSSTLYSHLV